MKPQVLSQFVRSAGSAFAAASLLLLTVATPSAAQIAAIGLSSVRAQSFENEDLLFYAPEQLDLFGWSFAAGDFNGDGADDLATGAPSDDGLVGSGLLDCGTVFVRYGVRGRGLAGGLADTVLSQFVSGSPNPPETGDQLGQGLAAGDFNGDGFDDLAISAPGDREWNESHTEVHYGSIEVHYGGAGGIDPIPQHHVHWDATVRTDFGWRLASGNFNGDAYDDLAIGIPRHRGVFVSNSWQPSGGVSVLLGEAAGLTGSVSHRRFIDQGSVGILDVQEIDDEFGASVAVGNFDADAYDDLAIGIPGENGSGAVQIVMGWTDGFFFPRNRFWLQSDVPGGSANEAGDRFGHALATGDFDGDGHQDLAIGAPTEDLGASGTDAGEISVLYGGSPEELIDLARSEHFRQSSIFGSSAYDSPGDRFGWALAVGDFEGDGFADLAIGQPGENVGGVDRGGVTILNGGSGTGLYERYRFVAAGINGVLPGVEDDASMGYALGVGDFDGSGTSDLASGMPFRDVDGIPDAGAENILYGSMFGDGFDSGNDWYWSASAP